MRLCVVPMKPLAHAKQRLAVVFSPEERRTLSLAMLTDVIAAGKALDAVWVICSDDDAAEAAAAAGAVPVPDRTPGEGLNASLAATTLEAVAAGARGMLIVSADCPAATTEDIRAVALGEGVALATDRSGTGTNALWRQPCDVIPTWFGRMSRRAHSGTCYGRRIPFARVPRERLAVDADTPRDLDRILRLGPGPATTEALRRLGYPPPAGGQ